MKLKHFGTDGIRGVVDEKLNFELAYKVGKSLAINIINKNLLKKVVIGNDTRVSGHLIVNAIACGLMDYGVNVVWVGIVPTGCISYLASKLDVAYGVMVTASHNTPEMNGIKIINNLGYKLTQVEEQEVENIIEECYLKPVYEKGKIEYNEQLVNRYVKHIKDLSINLKGIRIVVDCANGSNYKIAPQVYRDLGAEVIEINTDNDGNKININCGALHIDSLKKEVLDHKCDIGFAFDGDADRLVIILNNGKELKGDELIYLFANFMLENDELNSLTVVGTIMTNLGCEQSLNELGIKLERVDVGDKNVIEKLRINNYSLGGESSGHVCLHSYNTTCDALINSLILLKIINNDFEKIKTLLLPYKTHNNYIKNIVVTDEFRKSYNSNTKFLTELDKVINGFKGTKIIVRPSGTESVIRIFAESENSENNTKAVCAIEKFIKNHIKQCCEKN